ncbi:DNA ligase D [Alteribacter populi]|uniref:DNA ligase D n=1 Tax=Alteribacter populi TaxID=2011011 RepID=UPI000BBA5530|nr:DNA ligase D [Alteribacter populi]
MVMLPTRVEEWPENKNSWYYEVKYDGFRCQLQWTKRGVTLLSRGKHSLNERFPEIVSFCKKNAEKVAEHLPLTFDGELTMLTSAYTGDFEACQKRGRMKSQQSITLHQNRHPASFLAFDLLKYKGKNTKSETFKNRKSQLLHLFKELSWPLSPEFTQLREKPVQYIPAYSSPSEVWEVVTAYNGEGIIAKEAKSKWIDQRTMTWQKIKHYKAVRVLLTGEKDNGYFTVGVVDNANIIDVGSFHHGLQPSEREALQKVVRANSSKTKKGYQLENPLCITLNCTGMVGKELREPRFHSFELNDDANTYTKEQMTHDLHPIPDRVGVTNVDKILFPEASIDKRAYLHYLQLIGPLLLPWLKQRPITVIRYPDGIHKPSFYQKNVPDFAPSFVETKYWEGHQSIVVNKMETLLWLGNQAAIEFHIPSETVDGKIQELYMDLDPPTNNDFPMAVRAAIDVKELCDDWGLTCLVKTSGRKGLQVYLPIPAGAFTYKQCRIFLSFLAEVLIKKNPDERTTERLKSKRGSRLYIDYLQHGKGKTIIAPYSLRALPQASISTLLEWNEMNSSLKPSHFTIQSVLDRTKNGIATTKQEDRVNNQHYLTVLLKELDKSN